MTERVLADMEESVEDLAAYWLVRLSASDCTPAERHAFEAWKAEDPHHEAVYLRLQQGNALLDRHMHAPEIDALLDEAREASPARSWVRHWPKAVGTALAACLAIAVAVNWPSDAPGVEGEAATEIIAELQPQIFETAVGEQSRFALDDGTIVTLNTNSRIEVAYTGEAREVVLLQGQGYFEVERDITRPFSVEAGDRRVVALGTAFDVLLDEIRGVEVTLIEGEVKVDFIKQVVSLPNLQGAASPIAATTEPVILKPGDQLVASLASATRPEIREVRTTNEIAWTKGLLVYQAEPIESAIAEINRYSRQRLVLADDERLSALTIDGVFKSGSLSGIIAGLENSYPIEVQRTGSDELTIVWRE